MGTLTVAGTTSNLIVNGGAELSARNAPHYGWVKINGNCEWGAFTSLDKNLSIKPRSGGKYFFAPVDNNDGKSLTTMINQITTAPTFDINSLPGLIPGGYTPGNMPPGHTPGKTPSWMPSIPGLPSMQDMTGKSIFANIPGVPQMPPGQNMPGISGLPGIPSFLPGMSGFFMPGLPSIKTIQEIKDLVVFWAKNFTEAETTLVQEIDVSLFKNFIDAGVQKFNFNGYYACYDGGHQAEIAIACYNKAIDLSTQTEISKRFSESKYGEIPLKFYNKIWTGKETDWQEYAVEGTLPINTRKVYIFIRAWRSFNALNTYYAGCFDDLTFTMPIYRLPVSISANTVTVGQSVKITPDPGYNFSGISYESYNGNIATVDASGNVKGINQGTAIIKVIDPVFKKVENTVAVNVVGVVVQPTDTISGNGTSASPYVLSKPEHLAWLAQKVNAGDAAYNNKYYKLADHISLYDYGQDFNNGKGWIPIGTLQNPFKGIFDGNGKQIQSLNIYDSTETGADYRGLFGYIQGGVVKDLAIIGGNVSGRWFVGGLAGCADQNSLISNCYASCSVNGGERVGGIAGGIDYNSRAINCIVQASVNGSGHVGGIAGYIGNGSEATNCHITSDVFGKNNVGGIVGWVNINSKVTNCVALNRYVRTASTAVGRIAGLISNSNLSNNAAFDEIHNNAENTSWNNKGASAKDGVDLTRDNFYEDGTLGGRFTGAGGWLTENGKLPALYFIKPGLPLHFIFSGGTGQSRNPYIITKAEQLFYLHGGWYKLGADINLSAYGANYNGGKGWKPTGSSPIYLDGNGKTISNLYINDFTASGADYVGLFARLSGCEIKNLALVNVSIFGRKYVGGIVGSIDNGVITNCSVTGVIGGGEKVGGITGWLQRSRMENCFSTVAVNGLDNSGGIAGSVDESSKVANCYATGEVGGNNNVGGIAGSVATNGSITGCIALNPSVKMKVANGGRVAGLIDNGTLPNNAAFDGMLNNEGNTTWKNIGILSIDGADVSKATINGDGSLGGRFTKEGGWTMGNGKLPGLFGKTTDMPAHLSTGVSQPEPPQSQTPPETPPPPAAKEESILDKIINFILKLLNLYKESKQEAK